MQRASTLDRLVSLKGPLPLIVAKVAFILVGLNVILGAVGAVTVLGVERVAKFLEPWPKGRLELRDVMAVMGVTFALATVELLFRRQAAPEQRQRCVEGGARAAWTMGCIFGLIWFVPAAWHVASKLAQLL